MSGKKPRAKSTRAEQPRAKAPSTVKGKPRTDRRTIRTRDALGDALVELMQERPFKSLTVQDVLDRAGVGRSTFYTHYRDKDDLFISDVEEFWEMMSSMLGSERRKFNACCSRARVVFPHCRCEGIPRCSGRRRQNARCDGAGPRTVCARHREASCEADQRTGNCARAVVCHRSCVGGRIVFIHDVVDRSWHASSSRGDG